MNQNDVTIPVYEMIVESAPERQSELDELWRQYSPTFMRASDKPGYQMEGGAFGMILFTERTAAQMWIIGFAAWRALEAYCPYSFLRIAITPDAMADDAGLADAEQAVSDALQKARELKEIQSLKAFAWPDIPLPGATPPITTKDRAVVDLIKIGTAFSFLHEVQHEIFKTSSDCPEAATKEEYECDKFARDFLLERVSEYSTDTQQDRQGVLNKRIMGILLGAFVILEVTPETRRGGTEKHPPVADRVRKLILEPNYHASEHVWVYGCSLLLAKLREEAKLPACISFDNSRALFEQLLALL